MPYTTIASLRTARNARLQESDYCMLSDYKKPAPDQEIEDAVTIIKGYRKTLRDLPAGVKVDESGDAVLNSGGNLQTPGDVEIELPDKPLTF